MRTLKIPARIFAAVLVVAGGFLPAWAQQSPPKPAAQTEQAQAPNPRVRGAANPAMALADKVVISVGDEKITAAEIDQILRAMPPRFRGYYGGPGRRLLPQYIVELKVLAAEALKRKLEAAPEIRTAIELARDSILAKAAREEIKQSQAISDQQLEAAYDAHKAEFEEVRIREIYIRSNNAVLSSEKSSHAPLPSEEAQKKLEDLRKQILAGADFAEIAKKNSDDQATAAAGGDMGFITRQSVPSPVAQAAFSLKPGEVSDVISTPYGYELIKVEEKRTKPLAEVKETLAAQLRQSEFQKTYEELVKKYNVVVDTEFFTPPAQPPQATPTK